MIDIVKIVVTTDGAGAGSSAGSANSIPCNGTIKGIFVDYTSAPATTDVAIKETGDPSAEAILTLSDANTDVKKAPLRQAQGNTGADLTGVYTDYVIATGITVTVAQADAATVVTVYVWLEI